MITKAKLAAGRPGAGSLLGGIPIQHVLDSYIEHDCRPFQCEYRQDSDGNEVPVGEPFNVSPSLITAYVVAKEVIRIVPNALIKAKLEYTCCWEEVMIGSPNPEYDRDRWLLNLRFIDKTDDRGYVPIQLTTDYLCYDVIRNGFWAEWSKLNYSDPDFFVKVPLIFRKERDKRL